MQNILKEHMQLTYGFHCICSCLTAINAEKKSNKYFLFCGPITYIIAFTQVMGSKININ